MSRQQGSVSEAGFHWTSRTPVQCHINAFHMGNGLCVRTQHVDLAHVSESEKVNKLHLYDSSREEYGKPSSTDALHTDDSRQKSKCFSHHYRPLELFSSNCTLCCKPVTDKHQVLKNVQSNSCWQGEAAVEEKAWKIMINILIIWRQSP